MNIELLASKSTQKYKPFSVKVTRIIPIPKQDLHCKLYSVDKKTGTSNADRLLEFCKIARTRVEICEFLGKSAWHWIARGYLKPLMNTGRLLITIPDKPRSTDNKYITAENARAAIASAEGLLEFCMIPRRKQEIFLHFGLSSWQMQFIIKPLLADGRLICTDPTNPKNHWQKFVTAASDKAITNEAVAKFCEMPRTREEMGEFLDGNPNCLRRYIDVYIQTVLNFRDTEWIVHMEMGE